MDTTRHDRTANPGGDEGTERDYSSFCLQEQEEVRYHSWAGKAGKSTEALSFACLPASCASLFLTAGNTPPWRSGLRHGASFASFTLEIYKV